MMHTLAGRAVVGTTILALSALAPSTAPAESVADFYRGKSIRMVVATSPGGDYDLRARLIARHIGRHIPGEPTIVPVNMPGGVGLQAANWMATQAPRDGTALHAIMQNMSAIQALGGGNVEYDTRKFFWIGNTTDTPNVINSWHTTGIRTVQDVMTKELVVGAPGTATSSVYYPKALNELVGTKFKIVSGYPGGNVVNLAMERGEVGGRGSNSWASWKSTHPEWLKENKIFILVQIAFKRDPELPDVPTMIELAKNEQDRQVMEFLSADIPISRAYITTPEVPADRVAALRHAFDATMKDPAFLAEAAKTQMDISPSTGEEAQKFADMIANTPPAVIAKAKVILDVK
jgi:tripartite-type tricarboxylate transporter receptor subunit TctC